MITKAKLFFVSTVLISIFICSPSYAQLVWEGDYTIETAEDITALSGYSEITGSLHIGCYTNPAPTTCTTFENLVGLENLTTVGSDLRIHNNNALTSLNGLEGLTSIASNLRINSNPKLSSLNGLENLTSLGMNLSISDNDALTDLSGLGNITSVVGLLGVGDNNALTSLNGLENITTVGGGLSIYSNLSLATLSTLSNISSVGGNLYIAKNYSLLTLYGLHNITSIGGYLRLDYNNKLTNLSGLNNITSIGEYIYLLQNNSMTSLNGLDNLTSVGDYLLIIHNSTLTNLCALYNTNLIGDELGIYGNTALSMETAHAIEIQLRNNGFTGTADIRENNGTDLVDCAPQCYIEWSGNLEGSAITEETSKTLQAVNDAYVAMFDEVPGWCGWYTPPIDGNDYYFCSMLDPDDTFPMPPGKIARADGTWNTYTESGDIDLSGTWDVACVPTLITLSSFTAIPDNRQVTIKWSTDSEVNNAGFNLYRKTVGGAYKKINAELIPAEGSPATGARYSFVDDSVKNRVKYTYLLEDIDLNGLATQHETVTAKPRFIYCIR